MLSKPEVTIGKSKALKLKTEDGHTTLGFQCLLIIHMEVVEIPFNIISHEQ
jgi:hypothetical protein